MAGEWDDVLAWPLRADIRLAILQQNSGETENSMGSLDHIEDVVEAGFSSRSSEACQRPTCARSLKGIGFSKFVSVDFLRRCGRKYIRNNTLVLRARVGVVSQKSVKERLPSEADSSVNTKINRTTRPKGKITSHHAL